MTGLQVQVAESALVAFLLALARTTGFVLVAPPFNSRTVPGQAKAALCIGLALPLASAYDANRTAVPRLGSTAMLFEAVLQTATGLALGYLVLAAVAAVQAAGDLIDTVGGFSISMAMDPLMMTQTSIIGRLHQMTAVAVLFVTDGHLMVMRGLTHSVTLSPEPLSSWAAAAQAATEGLAALFLGALQIAAPLIAAMLVADVALGLLTRAAPALNAFALGFPLKIFITLLLAALAVTRIPEALEHLVENAVIDIFRIAGTVRPDAGPAGPRPGG